MLFRIAVCCVKKGIKIAWSSMFLKPPLQGVHVCVRAVQKRSRILWGESLEHLPASPCCCGSPWLSLSWAATGLTLQAPACVFWCWELTKSVNVHMLQFVSQESGGHLEDSICVQWKNQECTWVAKEQHTELGFLCIGVELWVTAVIYTAEMLHLGSWTGCGLLEWRITIQCRARFPRWPLQLEMLLLSLG